MYGVIQKFQINLILWNRLNIYYFKNMDFIEFKSLNLCGYIIK